MEKFGYKNPHEIPKLTKIVLNMGVGDAVTDKKKLNNAMEELALIAGQKPVMTTARKSIATFKLREGMPIGNFAFGIKEQIIFPEINYEKVEEVRGMDIVICTTAKTDEEAKFLLTSFNLPYKK